MHPSLIEVYLSALIFIVLGLIGYLACVQVRNLVLARFLIFCLLLFVVFVTGAYWIAYAISETNKVPAAIIFTGLLATIGWTFGSLHNRLLIKHQYTNQLIDSYKNSNELRVHLNNITTHFPPEKIIPKDRVKSLYKDYKNHTKYDWPNNKFPAFASVVELMNFYEHVAQQYFKGYVAKGDIKSYFNIILYNTVRKIHPIIYFIRSECDNSGAAYSDIRELMLEWYKIDIDLVRPPKNRL